MFEDKVLLITGVLAHLGTPFFGDSCKQASARYASTAVTKRSRTPEKILSSDKLKFHIGDVRDPQAVLNAMRGVDYVFHAAALKQVPSCEFHPMEAVKTNVLGTEHVVEAAIECAVRKVICLSTDKAVYPINAMGISKAMMEKVFVAKARTVDSAKTVICGTRYGNVMASRGSVIPLFVDQILAGKPITVTDPAMTRFMMTLDDAVDLVLYAFEHAQSGDIFVQKAPASRLDVLETRCGRRWAGPTTRF